jgi:hypothetical protein
MMFSTALLAVSLPDNPVFADNLQFQLTGLLVVLTTLGSLSILVALIGKIFIAVQKVPASAAIAAPGISSATPAGDIPGPVFAAIAAAVSTALGDKSFTIRGVQAVDPRDNMSWGAEGRRAIYASRKLR